MYRYTLTRRAPWQCSACSLRAAAKLPTARDTNDAGDVHIGAFIAALAAGADPHAAARYANAAALAVARNNSASAPSSDEVEALLTSLSTVR